MKIINLQAENIKRIKAVDITPHENVVVIAGKNGEGKSSVLDSIYWALAGTKPIQDKPIRDGEEKASVRLDLGKYVVLRKFTESGSTLEVRSAEGAKFNSPQDLLNELTASITFDPLDFARMKPEDQYKTLRGLVKIDVDIDALDKANASDFEARTDINRTAKALLAEYEGMKARLPADVPTARIDVVAVSNQINAMKDEDRSAKDLESRIANGNQMILDIESQIKELQAKLDLCMKGRAALIEQFQACKRPAPEEIKNLEDQLADANRVNAAFDLAGIIAEKKASYNSLHDRSVAMTKNMEEREAQKNAAIAAAKMPIAGLGIAAGHVTFNGIPFDQASSAEQIRVSTSIAIAMKPELRVIRIKDGSLLDDDSMIILREMAASSDFQIWVERVGGNEVGIIIEDGQVKNGAA